MSHAHESLCQAGVCPLSDDGIPLYVDATYVDAIHLRRACMQSDAMHWLDDILGSAPVNELPWRTESARRYAELIGEPVETPAQPARKITPLTASSAS